MSLSLYTTPAPNIGYSDNSTGGVGMTFNSSLNIVSSIDTSPPGSPWSNLSYQVKPLIVYGQPTIIPNTTTPAPTGAYTGAATAHYSLQSYSCFVPSPGPAPGGGGYVTGGHMKFIQTPTGQDTPTNYVPSSTSYFGYSPQVIGTILQPGGNLGISYTTLSDYRLKENITPIENGLDYIMPLRPRRFNWKDSHMQTVGFIAHEIQEDAPPFLASTVVAGEKDAKKIFVNLYKNGELMLDDFGNAIERIIPTDVEIDMLKLEGVTWTIVREEIINQSVDTNGFISPLVASIQELKHMTDSQKQKINNLKSRIKILEEAF